MDRLNAELLAVARRSDPHAPAPLSFAQRRLWYRLQLEPDNASYRLVVPLRIDGPLDIEALERSGNEIISRHHALRTRFVAHEAEVQALTAPFAWHPFERVDLTQTAPAAREAALQQLIEAAGHDAFDLTGGPLVHNRLVRLGPEAHTLVTTFHHIACDGQSTNIWARELVTLYEAFTAGRPSPLRDLPVQYADYAAWQHDSLEGPHLREQLAWWTERLRGAPPVVTIPADRQHTAAATYSAAAEAIHIDEGLALALRQLSRREGVTLFTVLLAAFSIVLQRYSGQDDVPVSTVVAGRNRSELEHLIGLFVNALVLRVDLADRPTFRSLLRRAQNVAADAYDRQDLPFERLVQELQPARSPAHQPFSPLMLQFIAGGTGLRRLSEGSRASFSFLPVRSGGAGFDLALSLWPVQSGIAGSLVYNANLFERATIEGFGRQLQSLLGAAAADPDQPITALRMTSPEESRRMLVEWDRSRAHGPDETLLHERFDAHAHRDPGAVALSFGTHAVTYGELAEASTALAIALVRSGGGSASTVAVVTADATHRITAMLGASKAGAAFGCLDPAHPAPHVGAMLEELSPDLIVVSRAGLRGRPAVTDLVRTASVPVLVADAGQDEAREWLGENAVGVRGAVPGPAPAATAPARASTAAYVAFTSGSTGPPKAIVHTHRSFSTFLAWFRRAFAVEPGTRIGQWTAVTFDPSLADTFAALTSGATLCMPSDEARRDPVAAIDWLRRERISHVQVIPSFATHLLAALRAEGRPDAALPDLRFLLLAGEPVPVSLARDLLAACPAAPRVFNLYGPTETIVATCHEVTPRDLDRAAIPAGRPIDGCHVLVLDDALEPAPPGVPGEVYVKGFCVSEGYVRRPSETAAAFLRPSAARPGARMYRTGDIGRLMPDGTLVLMGRRDLQLKVRGVRVEPEAVEAALGRCPGIREVAVALARGVDDAGIVAYFAPREHVAAANLRAFARQHLPAYLVPSHFVRVDALPRTTSGKIDRTALPPLAPGPSAGDVEPQPPRTPLEAHLAALFERLLGVGGVAVHENFFERGGHSLLAVRLLNAVRLELGTSVPLRAFLEAPTIEALARLIEQSRAGEAAATSPDGGAPLAVSFSDTNTLAANPG